MLSRGVTVELDTKGDGVGLRERAEVGCKGHRTGRGRAVAATANARHRGGLEEVRRNKILRRYYKVTEAANTTRLRR